MVNAAHTKVRFEIRCLLDCSETAILRYHSQPARWAEGSPRISPNIDTFFVELKKLNANPQSGAGLTWRIQESLDSTPHSGSLSTSLIRLTQEAVSRI